MTNKYKKGDGLILIYRKPNSKDVQESTGVVFKISDSEIILGHNFLETSPIDFTTIPLKNILKSEMIVPKEINSLDDLN